MADNTIVIRGPIEEEGFIAASALTPGELVEFAATEDQVQANSSAADTAAQKMWVREQWENDGNGVDDDVPASDQCTVIWPAQNAKIRALIAHGTNVQQGAALESDGNGALQAVTSGRIVAFAAEDINNTSGSASLGDVYVA